MDIPSSPLKKGACFVEDKATEMIRLTPIAVFGSYFFAIPVFIAHSVGNGYVRQLRHDGPCGRVHEIKRPFIVWLLKLICGRES